MKNYFRYLVNNFSYFSHLIGRKLTLLSFRLVLSAALWLAQTLPWFALFLKRNSNRNEKNGCRGG